MKDQIAKSGKRSTRTFLPPTKKIRGERVSPPALNPKHPVMEAMDLKNPLNMNLGRQTRSLSEKLGTDSQFASHILSITSVRELLDALSQLLVTPAFTLLVAREFRPVLFDLCARWLLVDGRTDEILTALCLLLEPHPELFP